MDEFLKPLDKGHSELKICLTWSGSCESDEVRMDGNGYNIIDYFLGYSTRS
jgi:hypothetical protein